MTARLVFAAPSARAALADKPVTADMLQADIDAGAPTNPDGSINLVHYAAWLVKEMSVRAD